ncbi:hypothetical protein BN871_FY_00070 [Paenibacillus sp. P22]|nr:hypothetical protein BN871_FY_00070 [Paenibacillus sp. P22]
MFVEADVGLGGTAPAVIVLLAVADDHLPSLFVAVIMQRPADGIQHVMGVVMREAETVAFPSVFVERLDGVLQPSRLSHDRHRSVAQRQQLAEAARLELGRHEIQVGAGVDAAREPVIEAGADAAFVIPGMRGLTEHLLVFPFPGTEDRELHVFFEQLAEDGVDQVEALLLHQPGHDADDRNVRPLGQAHLPLQGELVGQLVRSGAAQLGVERLIRSRIEVGRVDAVDDARQIGRSPAQKAVQPFPVISGLDLLGITRAYGRKLVRVEKSALHAARRTVEFQAAFAENLRPHPDHIHHFLLAEYALIPQVMDREYGTDAAQNLILEVTALEQERHEPRLPIVAVQHIEAGVHPADRFEHGDAEEHEALRIVAVAVQSAPAEVMLVVDEIIDDSADLSPEKSAVLHPPSHLDRERVDRLEMLQMLPRDAFIFGQDYAGSHPVFQQSFGQCADHVGKAARLSQGHSLRCHEQYIHGRFPPGQRKRRQLFLPAGRPPVFLSSSIGLEESFYSLLEKKAAIAR